MRRSAMKELERQYMLRVAIDRDAQTTGSALATE
jgi:hypothetical protein